ncbi:hypothetical protein ACIOK4_43615 [Streptomyces bottropensis]|uniref:hypothetical protein n=1 Tax=Streptomyces bottropensis TaxID=42235 RepID=UPI0038167927
MEQKWFRRWASGLFGLAVIATLVDMWLVPSAVLGMISMVGGLGGGVMFARMALREGSPGKAVRRLDHAVSLLSEPPHAQAADPSHVVELARRALGLLDATDVRRYRVLGALSDALRLRFGRLGRPDDIEEAVETGRAALAAARRTGADHAWIQAGLGAALRIRFAHLGRLDDLDEAVELGRAAARGNPEGTPLVAQVLADLAVTLRMRYVRTGADPDLDEAWEWARSALAADPENPWALSAAAQVLLLRVRRADSGADLNDAIAFARKAAAAEGISSLARSRLASNLGRVLLERFQRTRSAADLDEALTVTEAALAGADTDPERATTLSTRAEALLMRFNRTREPADTADINAAVDIASRAAQATRLGQNHYTLSMITWGRALLARHERRDAPADLESALSVIRAGADAMPTHHIEHGHAVAGVAAATLAAAQRSGSGDALRTALDLSRSLADASPGGSPVRTEALRILTASLVLRFMFAGTSEDVDEAVALSRGSTEGVLVKGHVVALLTRFRYRGALADMETAIAATRSLSPADSEASDGGDVPGMLAQLLYLRFNRTMSRADIDEAVETARAAVDATPLDHRARGLRLSHLAISLHLRAVAFEDPDDLLEAVARSRAALEAAPHGSTYRADLLANLADVLQSLAESAGPAWLDEAVEQARAAVDAVSGPGPRNGLVLYHWGKALTTRFRHTGALDDVTQGVDALRTAASLGTLPASLRTAAARLSGEALAAAGRWRESVGDFSTAVEFLARVSSRGVARIDQEHGLRPFDGVASEAASCALNAGDIASAVGLLEQGRGVLFGQMLDLRPDLERLTGRADGLAARLGAVRDALNGLPDRPEWIDPLETPDSSPGAVR